MQQPICSAAEAFILPASFSHLYFLPGSSCYFIYARLLLLLLHPLNGLFSRTTLVSQHQKGKHTILDFTGARDNAVAGAQLDHMQIICTSLQTGNHTITSTTTYVYDFQLLTISATLSCLQLFF